MSRNFSMGSRFMTDAGRLALTRDPSLSLSSRKTMSSRWAQFVKFLRFTCQINKMEYITKKHIIQFSNKIAAEGKSPSYHRNLISAINRVMSIARRDKKLWLSPTRDCRAPSASYIRTTSKALPEQQHKKLLTRVSERLSVQLCLQRHLGLRFKESCLINAKLALKQVQKTGYVRVVEGTKGGRPRQVEVSDQALQALEKAVSIQGKHQSLIPKNLTFIQYSRKCYYQMRRTSATFHQERHYFTQDIYKQSSGVDCPVSAKVKHGKQHLLYIAKRLATTFAQAKKIDRAARFTVSATLGHFRFGASNAYIG